MSWDIINIAMQTPALQTITNNYQGSFYSPLPVELSSFTSIYLNDNIQLNWTTKTEVRNDGILLERTINEGEWNSISFLEGHGNSNSKKNTAMQTITYLQEEANFNIG